VLPALKQLLSPDGAILIQTPNAAAVSSRWKLLFGENPYELIRVDRTNPGHFREYTLKELTDYATDAGFQVSEADYCNYWQDTHPVFRWMENTVPSFRRGISILLDA